MGAAERPAGCLRTHHQVPRCQEQCFTGTGGRPEMNFENKPIDKDTPSAQDTTPGQKIPPGQDTPPGQDIPSEKNNPPGHDSVIRPAARMELLPEYVFGRLNAEKQRRRAAGIDIIDFGMGNPDMPASSNTVDKIHQVLDDEKAHRYSRAIGIPHLLRAVADHYKSGYGVDLDSETEIITTIGSKEGLSHLSLALLGPGDRCVV
ncbi:MAG: aminotransferase class I/II-fold pyridoxal phosphate-dependent enzyme, partial [Balneolaceae bacterium]